MRYCSSGQVDRGIIILCMSSDKQLVRAIKEGDSKSFDRLFEKYYDRFFSFACCLLHDGRAAEDVLQNVFLKLWLSRERLDENRSIENYLLVSVRNEIFDYLRLKYNQLVLRGETPDAADSSADIETNMLFLETSDRMDRIIRNMPKQRQRIFMMSRFENMPAKEIADKLGLSIRTVERHIYLALKDLKQLIS